jgi:hypothetical protein
MLLQYLSHEVACEAGESAAEVTATHQNTNHGNPDHPKFDGCIVHSEINRAAFCALDHVVWCVTPSKIWNSTM